MKVTCISLCLSALLWGSAAGAWTLNKSANSVTANEIVGDRAISITCYRHAPDRITISISDLSQTGRGFERETPLMAWVRLPDGRTMKWSFSGVPEGPAFAGVMPVSSQNLDFFGNAESLSVQDQASGQTIVQTGMKGTGAARIAMRERCGF
ncbi:hypothetical protein [Paracoccus sphaerophysae]|uniref:Uncharacterized protein n=1 Tax=Paracoccus sphaerophysae TaxID=690417 RepID=A0A099FGS6_9RHOB|nr:hypothetical protein [Paracoccus sphaerophysae]KGJ09436.1 hypothetical protein IC63_01345 [Paracoccus sphaerophysae]